MTLRFRLPRCASRAPADPAQPAARLLTDRTDQRSRVAETEAWKHGAPPASLFIAQ
jgi:hypothetical protein